MNYRNPTAINRELSVIGFGAWQLGNAQSFLEMKDEEAIELVREAINQGVNVFDTAPGYGEGNSERLLGIALQPYRKHVFINTKFGHTPDNRMDFSSEGLYRSIEGSLKRLQTDYLDSVILHNPPRELLDQNASIYQTLYSLKQQGVIRHYGVSIDSLEELDIVLHHNNVDVIELLFNILHQAPKALFDEIRQKGIMLLVKVPLDSGWLSGKYTKDTTFTGIRSRWTKDVKEKRLEIVERIKDIVGPDDLAQKALQFILHFDAVTCVIPGTTNISQLESNVNAQEATLAKEEVTMLEELYETYIKHQDTPW